MPRGFHLIILIAAISCVIFYLIAGAIYDLHFKLKKTGNPLSKVVTSDVKYLDDKELWVKRYRAKLLFLLFVIISIPLFRLFFT